MTTEGSPGRSATATPQASAGEPVSVPADPVSARDLGHAYRATRYCVYPAPGEVWTLRVEQPAPAALEACLQRLGVSCWALLSAHNPASRRLSDAGNAARQEALRRRLTDAGRFFFPGENLADGGDWPPEASVWAPGLSQRAALALAAAFGQNALLWGEAGGRAELLWVLGIRRRGSGGSA